MHCIECDTPISGDITVCEKCIAERERNATDERREMIREIGASRSSMLPTACPGCGTATGLRFEGDIMAGEPCVGQCPICESSWCIHCPHPLDSADAWCPVMERITEECRFRSEAAQEELARHVRQAWAEIIVKTHESLYALVRSTMEQCRDARERAEGTVGG